MENGSNVLKGVQTKICMWNHVLQKKDAHSWMLLEILSVLSQLFRGQHNFQSLSTHPSLCFFPLLSARLLCSVVIRMAHPEFEPF